MLPCLNTETFPVPSLASRVSGRLDSGANAITPVFIGAFASAIGERKIIPYINANMVTVLVIKKLSFGWGIGFGFLCPSMSSNLVSLSIANCVTKPQTFG